MALKFSVNLVIPFITIVVYVYLSIKLLMAKECLVASTTPTYLNADQTNQQHGIYAMILPYVNQFARSSVSLRYLYVCNFF